jgi:divalent metal cation (Fe/Co/Zn/Cd) transporter
MSHSNSTKAVVFALLGNMFISIIKYIAAFFLRYASMLAEAIHSTADCLNQVFLLIGTKRSKKKMMSYTHLGMVVKSFFLGFYGGDTIIFRWCYFSIYEGVHKLMEPIAIKKYWLGSCCFRCFNDY